MTREELNILRPMATRLREAAPDSWRSLMYETQFGPVFQEFPYHPAASDFEGLAQEAIHGLPRNAKTALVALWRSQSRLISVTPNEAILDRYAIVLIEYLVQRARAAAARTTRW